MIRKKQENYGPYVIDLTGPQGNAFVLLGYAKQFARQLQFDYELKNKIVKVIVRQKTDQKKFEKFIDKLYSSGIQELKIIENFQLHESDDFEVEDTENTIGILNRYIDESDFEGDKTMIKGILQKIYAEACEVD